MKLLSTFLLFLSFISSVYLRQVKGKGECRPDEYFSHCGGNCRPTCTDQKLICMAGCIPSCDCNEGTVRDEESGKCMKLEECPPRRRW